MPFSEAPPEDGIGLELSGGGFRAVLFHIGALRRLVEFGVLTSSTRIPGVSGGSIIAGRLAKIWEQFASVPTVEAYDRLAARPLQDFSRRRMDAKAIGSGILSPFGSAASEIRKLHAISLMARRLDELPDTRVFVCNVANMRTGRSFRSTKGHLADCRIGISRGPTSPVAFAVAASSTLPPSRLRSFSRILERSRRRRTRT